MNVNATTDARWLAEEILDAMELDGAHGADRAAKVSYVDNRKGHLSKDRSFHKQEPAAPAEPIPLIASVVRRVSQARLGEAAPSHVARHRATLYIPMIELTANSVTVSSETGSFLIDGVAYFIRSIVFEPVGHSEPALAVIDTELDASI